MQHFAPSPAEPAAAYEVLVANELPERLLTRFPDVRVVVTGVQTSLRQRVSSSAQLEVLLDELAVLRVPLVGVHLLPGAAGEEPCYEVRVDGEVGESLLRHLGWAHHTVPVQTKVRITDTSGELDRLLLACSECGAGIQSVRRLDPGGRDRSRL